jgi:hypothetical protein
MTKTKIALIATTALGLFVAWQFISVFGSEGALMERFPDIDPDLVVKAHRQMYFAALRGESAAIKNAESEEDFDKIFLEIIETLKK